MLQKHKKRKVYLAVLLSAAALITLIIFIMSFIYRQNAVVQPGAIQNTNTFAEQLQKETGLLLDLSVEKHRALLTHLENNNLKFEPANTQEAAAEAGNIRSFYASGEQVTFKGVAKYSDDGNMKQVLALFYDQTQPQGTYQIIVQNEWVKYPFYLKNERVSLTSSDLTWLEEGPIITGCLESGKIAEDKPVQTMHYITEDQLSEQYFNVRQNKFFYQFDFPSGTISGEKDHFISQLWVKGKMKNYDKTSQMASLLVEYEHTAPINKNYSNFFTWDYAQDAAVSG